MLQWCKQNFEALTPSIFLELFAFPSSQCHGINKSKCEHYDSQYHKNSLECVRSILEPLVNCKYFVLWVEVLLGSMLMVVDTKQEANNDKEKAILGHNVVL